MGGYFPILRHNYFFWTLITSRLIGSRVMEYNCNKLIGFDMIAMTVEICIFDRDPSRTFNGSNGGRWGL